MKRLNYFSKLLSLVINLSMFVVSLIYVFPIIWMLYSSFKGRDEFLINVIGLPKSFHPENYLRAMRVSNIDIYLKNSLIISIITVLAVVIIGFFAGYCLSRYRFKSRKFIYTMFLTGIMIPIYTLLIPVFIEFKYLKIGGILAIIITYTAINLPITIFLIEGFVKSIPCEMEESAYISGCTVVRSMFMIILPLCKPVISTAVIITFLSAWNEFAFALVLISKNSLKTIPLGLANFIGMFSTDYTSMMAGSVLAIIPILIVYFVFSKQIVKGMTAGAVKG